jgi:hypothetical protein
VQQNGGEVRRSPQAISNSPQVIQRDAGVTAAVLGTGLAALGIIQNQVNASNGGLNYSSDQVTYPKDLNMVPGETRSVNKEIAYFFSAGGFIDNKTKFNLCGDFGENTMANVRIELAETTSYYTSALSFTAKALQTPYGTKENPKIRFVCSGRFDPAGIGDCSYSVILEVNDMAMVKVIERQITNGKGDLSPSWGGFKLYV